ncbi:DUF2407 C-terminal domain-containing protein [Xylariaceae sp. FL0594]|nr:DUF2407 C-terminal domain-containing protein [Xylariaceae sp. FL0594]
MNTATMPPPPVAATQPAPLLLTIRFSASLPDLELDIPRPGATTVVSLKHLIRSRLDKAHERRRLRFIHGGRILPDTAVLSSVLRALPPPPPLSLSSINYDHDTSTSSRHTNEDGKGKGKGKSIPGRPEPAPRIYVNCSIGDELTPSELAAEERAASLPPPHPTSKPDPTTTTPAEETGVGVGRGIALPTPTPRGFDRLLSAGFTPSEVNQLRLQFRNIHASRYTPDTLPSPDTFRQMEDSWIDSNPTNPTNPSSLSNDFDGGQEDNDGGGGSSLVSMIDVLVSGVVTGFLWPLGSAGWLVREEGLSSDRWRFMVVVGVLFSVLIGFIRAIAGDK